MTSMSDARLDALSELIDLDPLRGSGLGSPDGSGGLGGQHRHRRRVVTMLGRQADAKLQLESDLFRPHPRERILGCRLLGARVAAVPRRQRP
jgi:hypothetical protein